MKQSVTKTKTLTTLSLIRPFFYFSIACILLIFILPTDKTAMKLYHLTSSEYQLLIFVFILPYMLVWLAAFYGYAKLSQYTVSLQQTGESNDYNEIARGTKWLAFGLPTVTLISLLLTSISGSHPGLKPTSIIIVNYLSLLIPLVAYNFIRKGSHGLVERSKTRFSLTDMRTIVMVLVVIGVAYCYFTFKKLNLDSIGSSDNPYYLPAWLMITTVIIPYLYAWFTGLLAAYEMVLYSRQVQGVLYRQAMRWLASGIVGVIVGGIGLQYLRTVVPRTGHLSISNTVLIANITYIILAVGFILLVIGATRLKKIEDV